ncbi:hypothetical protein [Sinorhizobium fredii]|uniref:hypothetical protein n=1 Tax=Rhizobium fredii TaxID=380 RepID=UPI001181BD01|nr:hypothetical protein [Sinorhizobium fredii]
MLHGIGDHHVVLVCAHCLRREIARLRNRGKGSAERSRQKQKDDGEPTQHAGKIGYSISKKKGRYENTAES